MGNGCLARLWACWRRLWTYPLLSWFAYLPLLAVFVAVLAVLLGAGEGLGAPSLVWHDDAATKVCAGFAVAVLCLQLGVVGYLLDSRENPNRDVAPAVATFESIARYVRWPLLVTLGCAVVGCFERRARTAHAGLVLIGPAVFAALGLWLRRGPVRGKPLLALVPERHHERLRSFMERRRRQAPERGAAVPDAGAHVAQGLLALVLALGYVAAWIWSVPAAVAVSVALALAIAAWGFLRYWFRRTRVVAAAALIVLGCALTRAGDSPVTGLSDVQFPKRAGAPPPRELLGDTDALERWRAQFPDENPPLVVVATSGGALRAALWTLNILRDLEGVIPGFMRHVRLVTGASGGMVGAAHLVSALHDRGPPLTDLTPEWWGGVMHDAAGDSLTPVARALILPWRDRGQALEESWEQHTNGRLAMPFRALLAGEREGWLPSLVYAPMMVEDGRRLLISNLELGALVETVVPGANGPRRESISAVQLFACEGDGVDAIKLSTVARLNATFPWVTSAARLTTWPDRRVVDAGYYDNFGVDVATAWIRKNAEWLAGKTSGVLLLQIRDETTARLDVEAEPGPGQAHEWISALSTPLEAFFSARSASMSFRNDQKVEVLADDPHLPHPPAGKEFFVTETFELAEPEPLEWYLGQAAIDDLERSPRPVVFAAVRDWWAHRPR
ncbi:MAG TPA: hypothetical protein VHL80_06340 [Polyangia bacterium]|nr:hypothetical protein [Polyangia bacterium]